jgi:hypothetical protein
MKSLRRVRSRKARCFELAFKAMMNEPGAEKFTLVHGYVHTPAPGVFNAHAWIETDDGRVYDATLDVYMPVEQYVVRYGAVIERRYTREEAAKMALDRDRVSFCFSGPWHTSIGRLADIV